MKILLHIFDAVGLKDTSLIDFFFFLLEHLVFLFQNIKLFGHKL